MVSSPVDTVGKRRERWSLSDDSAPPSAPASPSPSSTPSSTLPPITLTIPRSYIENAAKAPAASSSSCDVTGDVTDTRRPEAPSAKMAPDGEAGTGIRPVVAGDAAVAVPVAATPSPVKSNSSPTKKFHCQICTRGTRFKFFSLWQCCGSGMFIPDPGSNFFPSRIPDPNCHHPGSRIHIKEFKHFNPKKNGFWALENMIRVVHPWSRILMLTLYPSRIPYPGVKKAPDPGSGSATLLFGLETLFVKSA